MEGFGHLMNKKSFSLEHDKYVKSYNRKKSLVLLLQIGILVFLIILWQIAASLGWIDVFIASSPIKICETFLTLIKQGDFLSHLFVTLSETLGGFIIGIVVGFLVSVILWWFPIVSDVLDPYLVVLNAMPKVALGPIIIIWGGAGIGSIIIMTLAISTISTIIGVYGGFACAEREKQMLLKTFGADKFQLLTKVVIPTSYANIISNLKINIGLCWVGVIMGEFLVSKAGLGYLIMYASQVFNLNLVMCGIILVSLCAAMMYALIFYIEKRLKAKFE